MEALNTAAAEEDPADWMTIMAVVSPVGVICSF